MSERRKATAARRRQIADARLAEAELLDKLGPLQDKLRAASKNVERMKVAAQIAQIREDLAAARKIIKRRVR